MPKVIIVYLVWSVEPQKFLIRALDGVVSQTYHKENLELLIVYNSHKPDEPSALPFIEENVKNYAAKLPHTTILSTASNLGFAGGNNFGMKWALEHGFDYIFFHNADGYLDSTTIERLTEVMEKDKTIGQSQPMILLHPERDLINSAGNALHYLGIGYCVGFQDRIDKYSFSPVVDVGYVSGAATMLRADLVEKYGAWNENFFLYHEDTEYSLRLKIRGFRTVMVSGALFYHIYSFNKGTKKFYWMERNRHALQLIFYRLPTLILIFPIELVYNIGLLGVALINGWFSEIMRVYAYWLSPKNWKVWLVERKKISKDRLLSDRELLRQSTPVIVPGSLVASMPVSYAANLVFRGYYYILKALVWW